MKPVSLFAVCFLLVVSSAFAQGNGLTIEFDKDTPASERQAFSEAYKHQQDINRNRYLERTVESAQSQGTPPQSAPQDFTPNDKDTLGDLYVKGLKKKAYEAETDRKMAENGDSEGLANRRQERSNRRTAEQLRQIQQTQQEIQNRQRGIGY